MSVLSSVVVAASGLDRRPTTVAVVLVYEVAWVGLRGRTPGKAMLGLSIVDEVTRLRPAWWQASIRAMVLLVPVQMQSSKIDSVGEWLVLLFVLGNAFTVARRRDDRRGLHDLAARTRPIAEAKVDQTRR